MFTFADEKLSEKVSKLVSKYEKHFDEDFPLQEYLEETNGIVTSENVESFEKMINKSIENNKLVVTPKDFCKRLY